MISTIAVLIVFIIAIIFFVGFILHLGYLIITPSHKLSTDDFGKKNMLFRYFKIKK